MKIAKGAAVLLGTVGSKYIHLEYNKEIDDILRCEIMRYLIVFSIVYASIEDVLYSLMITIAFFIIMKIQERKIGKRALDRYYLKNE
jgi:hypothetical protein